MVKSMEAFDKQSAESKAIHMLELTVCFLRWYYFPVQPDELARIYGGDYVKKNASFKFRIVDMQLLSWS